jgi:hypothetical protein
VQTRRNFWAIKWHRLSRASSQGHRLKGIVWDAKDNRLLAPPRRRAPKVRFAGRAWGSELTRGGECICDNAQEPTRRGLGARDPESRG